MTINSPFAQCYRTTGSPFVRGEGCRLTNTDGAQFLDLGAGVAVSSLGHNHSDLVAAIAQQASAVIHTSNLYQSEPIIEAAEKVTRYTGMDRVFFSNSGAEAIEAAIKISRRYAQEVLGVSRYKIVSMEHSFHGRTIGALSATGQPKYWKGFEPLVPGFSFVPYGNIDALEEAIDDETAAVLLEPLQGEGGVVVPPDGYLQAVRSLTRARGCLMIVDEIQTGIGRTGHFVACQGAGVEPDIITLAKGIAGGLPLGAMVHREAISEGLIPGTHASTFGGNPVCCAAANVVMDTVGDHAFLRSVREKGEYLRSRLTEELLDLEHVLEIRGLGLLCGVALDRAAKPFVQELFHLGVLTSVAGGTVLRLSPPLVVSKPELDEGVEAIASVLRSAS
jgi:predicted acetylornithine/succinylornithine family transaminase